MSVTYSSDRTSAMFASGLHIPIDWLPTADPALHNVPAQAEECIFGQAKPVT